MSVQILMSTYNGEKYIRTQLDSILEQDYEDIEVLIRDDGSADMTCEIINEYAEKYSNITWYAGQNIGVQKSFFDLITKADLGKEYYAFADQDDKWLPGKISRAVSILEGYQKDMPVLYCSDKIIVDEELRPLKVTVSRVMKKPAFGNAIVQDMCTGCTAVMNRSLLNLIRKKTPEYVIMHDWWFYLTATCFGEVFYDKESYILYRQHGNNTSGAMVSNWELIKYRFEQLSQPRGEIYTQTNEFYRIYGESLQSDIQTERGYQLLNTFIKSQTNMLCRVKLVFNRSIFRQKLVDDIIFRIILLIGKL